MIASVTSAVPREIAGLILIVLDVLLETSVILERPAFRDRLDDLYDASKTHTDGDGADFVGAAPVASRYRIPPASCRRPSSTLSKGEPDFE